MKSSFTAKGAGTETFKAYTPTGSLYRDFGGLDKRIFSLILSGVYQMREAAKDLATIGENEIKRLILHKGSYKPYSFKGRIRLSSQPGEPPAALRGETLEPSVYSQVNSRPNQNPAISEFGTTAPFARELEFGTEKIAPRPFVLPARQKVAARAPYVVAKNLQIAYSRAAMKQSKKPIVVEWKI